MDFFKGLFGLNNTPPASPQAAPTQGSKSTMNKAGPYMHPAYPHLAFAAVVSPPPSENVASTFVFYLWDRGVASFYRYVPKKAGDTTPGLLFQVLSNPSKWAPTDPGAPTVESIEFTLPPSGSTAASPSKAGAGSKKVQMKVIPRCTPSNPAGTAIKAPLDLFTELFTSYFDRLNRLLLSVDKKVKADPYNMAAVHPSFYACLVESTRLAYQIYFDRTADEEQKRMRYKTLNEWVTRLMLSLDNISIPLIPDPDYKGPLAPGDEGIDVIADPTLRLQRKSLLNLALGIGAELGALISGSATDITAIASDGAPLIADPTSLSHAPWESSESTSPVRELLRLALPPARTEDL